MESMQKPVNVKKSNFEFRAVLVNLFIKINLGLGKWSGVSQSGDLTFCFLVVYDEFWVKTS